ncbi:phage tail length tape measure family protein [Devosia sp. LjRoot16]|uniref:phage tail length tape measure family protein n=1 Tax=Devosia sp. LjRoot16 TaxID=3342271 RepID=UPI003ED15B0C
MKDANTAADAVVSSGRRANSALSTQNSNIVAMGKSSGAAARNAANLAYQWNDVAVSLASGQAVWMVAVQQGAQMAQIYGAEEGGLGRALKESTNLAVGLVTKFWPVAAVVAAGSAAIAGMTSAINDAGGAQMGFGDVAMATWQVFSEGVFNLVQPALAAVGGWFGDMWNAAWPVIKDLGNGIIATFIGAFDASKAVWSAFPAVMGDITITTANNVIGGVEAMINGAIGLLNDFKSSMGFAGDIGDVKLSGVSNPFEGATSGLAADVVASFQGAFDVDYLGGLFDAIKTKAIALASATDEVGKAAKSAGADMKPFSSGLEAANDNAARLGETLAGGLTQGVLSIWQAFKSGENVLEAIGNQLLSLVDTLLSNTVQSFFSTLFGGFKPFGGPSLNPGTGLPGLYANGGVFPTGISGYSNQVVDRPTMFAFANGAGLMGEAGAEAILPLRRGAGGRLGVESSGGGGTVNNFYIDAQGAEIGVEQKIVQAIKTMVPGMIDSQAPAAVARKQMNRSLR